MPPGWLVLAGGMLVSGLAGCYNPPSLQEGAPCQRTEQCPDPQQCVLGRCSLHESPADARPPAPDAAIDAPADAMPPVCSTAGLSCAGGTVTMFPCGGHCWVQCTAAVSRDMAQAACTGWTGALGEIDDATEQGCVAPQVSAPTWIGAIQSDTARTPSDGWTWNGNAATPLVYTSWTPGKPDDAGNGEDGMEQCASIRVGGGWDDDGCGQARAFFCERP